MRIAYTSWEYPPDRGIGGIATYVRQVAMMMRSRGHDVEVFATSPTRVETEIRDGVTVHWMREDDRWRFADTVAGALAARHAADPFDIIECPEYFAEARFLRQRVGPGPMIVVKLHTPSLLLSRINGEIRKGAVARYYAQQARVALGAFRRLRWPSGARSHRVGLAPWSSERMEAECAKRADLVSSPSRSLLEYAKREWDLSATRCQVQPYPFSAPAAMLALPNDSLSATIGFVGRLERRKGIFDLLDALPSALSKFPQARAKFIGASKFDQQTQRDTIDTARELLGKFSDRVEFTGHIDYTQLPGHLSEVGICVFPSIWENFPNVCLEAMSAGRAIVASRNGGMSEMTEDGISGLHVSPGAPKEIAAALDRLLADPRLRNSLGQAARSRVGAKYNWEVIGKETEDQYLSLLSSSRL